MRPHLNLQYLHFAERESSLIPIITVRKGGRDMAHPGVLNTAVHKEGPPGALVAVCVKSFPISSEQAEAAKKRGEIVYDVSYGQKVVLPGGVSLFHGSDDGLHDEILD